MACLLRSLYRAFRGRRRLGEHFGSALDGFFQCRARLVHLNNPIARRAGAKRVRFSVQPGVLKVRVLALSKAENALMFVTLFTLSMTTKEVRYH